MPFLQLYLTTFATVIGFLGLLWVLSVLMKDVSIVDPAWGLTFVVAAFTHLALGGGWDGRQGLITAMFTLWGVRLFVYLTWRKMRQHPGEDYRYARMREGVGKNYWWISFFSVFVSQGATAAFLSVVSVAAQTSPDPAALTIFDVVGFVVWGVGFYFETMADLQLARFKGDPTNKGKVLRTGVWALSRHPNYFGNACMWWGFWLVACSVPWGFLTIYAPIIMTYLLLRVSGVAMLERDIAERRPQYADYIRSVPAFVPKIFGGRVKG
jgi:steroid 5-alpha reductase family enzyme